MYLLGSFVGQQFEGKALEDLDFFPFPEINSEFGQDAVEAPIDGFMMAKSPKNEAAAKELLEYLGGADAQNTYLKSDPNNVATNNEADTSGYNAIQKKAAEMIAGVEADLAVPGPRHAARLRLHGDDPGAAAVHQDARRHRRADQEHRAAEEDRSSV